MNPCCNTTYTQTMLLANLWFILSLACPAVVGQTQIPENRSPLPQPASQPTAQAYWLRVTADRLNVRSQPDANSIVVTRVERDAILRALGSRFGWHRVLPPEGVFSYVSAAHVERQSETEGLVAVRSGTLRVRVGSLVRELDPLKSEVQTLLERGTPVRIVGAQGEWLKIVPPEGVYLYVSDKYVQQVSDEVAARLGAAITTTPQPAGITSGEPSPQPIAVAATQPAEGPDLSGPWGRRLVQVETAITAQAARPALEQAWDEPLTHLRPIAAQRAEPLAARLAAAWIVQLEERGADQEALRAAEEVLQRTARERARHERELERIKRLRQRAASQPAFSARGRVLRSYALGHRDGQPWYKLQNPLTQRVEVYFQIEPNSPLDPRVILGKYVGIQGERRFDQKLGADVVRAKRIVVLTPDSPAATRPTRREP